MARYRVDILYSIPRSYFTSPRYHRKDEVETLEEVNKLIAENNQVYTAIEVWDNEADDFLYVKSAGHAKALDRR